jgi:flagellar motor component MotA
LPAGLEAVARPLEQLSIEQIRQSCHGISRLVEAHSESVNSIGPGDLHRSLEAIGWQASPSVREALSLAADGTGPAIIRHFMRNRRDTMVRNLETHTRLVLEGVAALRQGEDTRLLVHRLDTVCQSGYDIQYREPENTTEQFRARLAQAPSSRLRHDELTMAIVDLAWIARHRGVAALAEVVEAIDDEYPRTGLQMVIDQVEPEQMAADLEGRLAPALRQVRGPFAAFAEGLCAVLEGKSGAALDEAVDAAQLEG